MLTNLVASGVFAVVTVTVIDWWLRNQEQRQRDAQQREEQQRLTVVRSVAYNAVARGPIAQRRIMWFLVHGGELRFVPEFRISAEHVHELRLILARLDLPETSEQDVMDHVAGRPCSFARFAALVQDQRWRQLVHEVLLDVVHGFRVLVARWSALLLATEESRRALTDLAAQVEELSAVFVAVDGRAPASDYVADRLDQHRDLWNRAFANAVAILSIPIRSALHGKASIPCGDHQIEAVPGLGAQFAMRLVALRRNVGHSASLPWVRRHSVRN